MDEQILEPVKQYNSQFKRTFAENAEAYFDALVKKAGVDVDANRQTVKKLNATTVKHGEATKRANSMLGVKVFAIVMSVFAFIAATVFIVLAVNGDGFPVWGGVLGGCLCFALGVGLIVVLVLKVNKVLEHRKKIVAELDTKMNELRSEAYGQLAALNALYDYGMFSDIVKATTPLLVFDRNVGLHRLDKLCGKYGYPADNSDPDSSVILMQSGEVVGNPFAFVRRVTHRMGTRVYTGSRVVTWTRHYTDSEGNSHTVTESQTLTATVTKPCPEYGEYTELVYANDAAPELAFSRKPSGASEMSERQVERTVKKGEKKLRKLAHDHMTDDDPTTNFTQMANSEFDVLFGATDRDNEVQFRLLFTPLAQQNIVGLIKSKEPYGDDFDFFKRGPINYIRSRHMQSFPLDADPSRFVGFDVDAARQTFLSFFDEYFRSVYFDFAPILSIPLYQQQKPTEYIYRSEYPSNCTCYEAEVMANALGDGAFAHDETATQTILKTKLLSKAGKCDRVVVSAYSYAAEPRVDYVPVFCRNGCMYDVAVPWTEYIPLEKHTVMGIAELDESGPSFAEKRAVGRLRSFLEKYGGRGTAFRRGILAFVPDLDSTPDLGDDWSAVIGNKIVS